MSRQEYVEKQLADHIKEFDEESTKHKKLYRKLRYVVFGLTAGSTTLAGIALALPHLQMPLNIAIVITSAVVGITTSIEGLRKPSELWIHERTLMYALRDLERDLKYRTAEGLGPSDIDQIYQRMQQILGSARDRWGQQIAGQVTTDAQRPQEAVTPKLPSG